MVSLPLLRTQTDSPGLLDTPRKRETLLPHAEAWHMQPDSTPLPCPSVVRGLTRSLWAEKGEPSGGPAREASRIALCQLAAPPCQAQMEPRLGLTQGSLGQLSPIPGAQGAGREKICFPVILSPPPG